MTEEKAKILIVDDDEFNVDILEQSLNLEGYDTISVRSGKEAIEAVKNLNVDLVLLDIMMPDMNGYEVCKIIKSDKKISYIPVIMLTAKKDRSDKVQGLDIGADDYVTKPFHKEELVARIRAMLRIKNIQTRLETISVTDELTMLYNRRYLFQRLDEELSRAKRRKGEFSIIMIDIDHFKKINDTYGHQFGDFVLKNLANIFRSLVRKEDIVARFGGEEFVIICPDESEDGAFILAERIRKEAQTYTFVSTGNSTHLTISLGIASFMEGGSNDSVDDLIKKVDEALYTAKKAGRNKTVKYSSISNTIK